MYLGNPCAQRKNIRYFWTVPTLTDMHRPVRIFMTFDEPEAHLADALKDHLRTAFMGRDIEFFERSTGMPEAQDGLAFLQTATCSVALLSNTFLLKGRNQLELSQARREESLRRPAAPLFLIMADPMVLPDSLKGFVQLPEDGESIRGAPFPVPRQLHRIASRLLQLLMDTRSDDSPSEPKLEAPPLRAPEFHLPESHIQVPEDLEGNHRLAYARDMALCLDALEIGQPDRGYALLDNLRQSSAPRSAQLYELLLIAFLQREGADAIVSAWLNDAAQPYGHLALFSQHLETCQAQGLCPTSTGSYNRRVVAEALGAAIQRANQQLYTDSAGDAIWRRQTLALVALATRVYEDIHPHNAALSALLTTLCGGGRGNWIERLHLEADGTRRFQGKDGLDLQAAAEQLVGMLQRNGDSTAALRATVLEALRTKATALNHQLIWEKQRFRRHTDERQEVIHLVHSALFAYHILGDAGPATQADSFLRLGLECLIPAQLLGSNMRPAAETPAFPLPVRWFDLDEDGAVRTHPRNADYHFDVMAVVRHLVVQASGPEGWAVIQANLRESVLHQYVRDTDAHYRYLRENRAHTDFRRMDDLMVRRATVDCLNRWYAAIQADPAAYGHLTDSILQELMGNRLLIWFSMNPEQLTTHPDSRALGYDAKATLRWITSTPSGRSLDQIQSTLASNIYMHTIAPSYTSIPDADGNKRDALAFILLQALHLYRDVHQDPVFLHLVYDEITLEHKLPWVMVDARGLPQPVQVHQLPGFNAWSVLEQLAMHNPVQWSLMEARRRIAKRRHRELLDMYYREISEDRRLNGLPERRILIQIMRQMRAIFHFFPEPEFLELSLRELQGKGRMQWQIALLNLFPIPQNQPENHMLDFDYKQELSDVRALIQTSEAWMQHLEDAQARALLQDTTPEWRSNSI